MIFNQIIHNCVFLYSRNSRSLLRARSQDSHSKKSHRKIFHAYRAGPGPRGDKEAGHCSSREGAPGQRESQQTKVRYGNMIVQTNLCHCFIVLRPVSTRRDGKIAFLYFSFTCFHLVTTAAGRFSGAAVPITARSGSLL